MAIKEDIKTRIDILIANVETEPFNFIKQEWNKIFAITNIDESSDYYIQLFNYIKEMSQQLDNSTQLNKIRIYRECLECELVVDAMISTMPAINRTSEMVSHQPFPYDNEITYRRYKKLKYTPKTAKSMSRYNDHGIIPRYVAEDEIIGLIKIYQSSPLKDNTPKEKKLSKNIIFDMLDGIINSGTDPTKKEEKQLNNHSAYFSEWLKKSSYKDNFDKIFNIHMEGALSEPDIITLIEPHPVNQYIIAKIINSYIWELRQGKYKSKLDYRNYKVNIVKHPKGYRTIILDRK